jgi:5-methylcytosine-specific restriction endonuclease McrA
MPAPVVTRIDHQIAELHKKRLSVTRISHEIGVSEDRVTISLKKNGLIGNNRWMPRTEQPVFDALTASTSESDFASRLKLTEDQAIRAVTYHELWELHAQAKSRWKAFERRGFTGDEDWMPPIEAVKIALIKSTSQSDYAIRLELAEDLALKAAYRYEVGELLVQAKSRWKECELEPQKEQRRQRYIEGIKDLAAELKRTPTTPELRIAGLNLTVIKTLFGSIGQAMTRAKLTPTQRGHTPAELPDDFVHNSPETSQAINRFRTRWIKAQLNDRQPYIEKIRNLAISLGYTPRQEDLRRAGIYYADVKIIFGSDSEAIRAAGLTPNSRRNTLPSPLPDGYIDIDEPDADKVIVQQRAAQIRHLRPNLPEPAGNAHPPYTTEGKTRRYKRDPHVIAWVELTAEGQCELCGKMGYEDIHGDLYLEVHHVVWLSQSGPDTPSNAVALCETCHGMLHRAKNREALKEQLYQKIHRLKRSDIYAVITPAEIKDKPSLILLKPARPSYDEMGNPITYIGRPRKGEVRKHPTACPARTQETCEPKKPKEIRPDFDQQGNPLIYRGRPRLGENRSGQSQKPPS